MKTGFTDRATHVTRKQPVSIWSCSSHLPSKRSQSGAGIRSPGDNEQQDDDERDLRHLPLTLHLMQPPHGVSGSLTADLRYRSVVQIGPVSKTLHFCSFLSAQPKDKRAGGSTSAVTVLQHSPSGWVRCWWSATRKTGIIDQRDASSGPCDYQCV